MPLRSKSLAFLIENPSNQNSSQLADSKQKRPVLIENLEPNRARLFAPLHAPQIAFMGDRRRSFAAFLTGTAHQTEIAVTHSKQNAGEFLTGARIECLTSQIPFLPGTAQHVEIGVTHSKQSAEGILPGARMCTQTRFTLLASTMERTISEGNASSEIAFSRPQPMWPLRSSLHLTNCRLNRLQLFLPVGVYSRGRAAEHSLRGDLGPRLGGFICL